LPISILFLQRNISTFAEACNYVKKLPYKRNTNPLDKEIVLKESAGTCSTKHALLRQLAMEHNHSTIKLMIGIFEMNEQNTPKVKQVLQSYNLDYIPEAHTYLKYNNEIIDCTNATSSKNDFIDVLLYEEEIQPHQILDYKIKLHKQYLKNWKLLKHISYSTAELWTIREACIEALQ
jgi:GMP synthase PP-ATPase subunit